MDEPSEPPPFQALDQVAEAAGAGAAEEEEEAPVAVRVAGETQPVRNGADEAGEAVAAAAATAAVSVPTPVLIVLPSALDSASAPTDSVEAPHVHEAPGVPSTSAGGAGSSSCCPTPSMPAPVPSPLSQPRRISVQLPLTLQMAYEVPQMSDTPPVSEQGAKDLYTRQVHWWQAHRQAATLRAQAEAKEREQQEVLECTFQPQNFTAQTYHPPHDRPRRHLHACPHPASARPPMTVPAVAPVAAAAAAADSHRAFSSLSPQRQRGAAADTSGVVTDVNMSPRTRRQIGVHLERQQLAREAKAHARFDLSRLSPQTVSPHVVRDYIQQQQRQHYHFADEEEGETMMEHELEGMGVMAIEEDSVQPSGAPIPLPEAGSARGSPQEPHQDLLLQLEQHEQQSPVLPRQVDARRVRHVAIDLRSPPSAGVGVHVAWGPAHVEGANAAEAEAAAASAAASPPSYLRATLAWERHHAQEKTAANHAHRGPSPPRRGSPPRSRHGGGLQQQPACRLAVGEEANSHGWGDKATAAPLPAASASRPYSPPGRRTAAAQQQQQQQQQRRAGVALSLSPLRSWPLAAAAAAATGSVEGRGGGEDGWPVLPAAAAAAAVVGGDGEEGWEEALESKEEAELTFFEQLQRERREWGHERAQLLTVIELQQRELGKRGGSVQERATEIARDFARSVLGFEERLLMVESALQSDVKEIRRTVERLSTSAGTTPASAPVLSGGGGGGSSSSSSSSTGSGLVVREKVRCSVVGDR